jgi:hypothetical protein
LPSLVPEYWDGISCILTIGSSTKLTYIVRRGSAH